MNDDWSDKVFDSFLEEVATGRHPPDLRARITAAWKQERANQAAQVDLAENVAERQNADDLVASPIIPTRPITRTTSKAAIRPASRPSHKWHVLLVVAASGILVACGIQWRSAFFAPAGGVAVIGPKENKAESSQLPQVAAVENSSSPKKSNAISGEKLLLDNVPFGSRENSKQSDSTASANSIAGTNRLNDLQIVELIDNQLATLWRRLNVTPESKLDFSALAQAVSRTLTGQELPSTTGVDLAELKTDERRSQAMGQVIAQATDSQAFARLWAKELVADWLQGGSLSLDSAPVQQLEQFVASGIASDRPWNEVIDQVISSDVLVKAFAGGGNHRMAAHLSGTFLDSSLGCVRCHDSKGNPNVAASQEQYWSLVATLMGLDVQTDEKSKTRNAIDKQAEVFAETKQPSLFFDRPDGTLVAAKFVLPDGEPWQSFQGAKTPKEALAKWIGNSHQADQAIVNQVWQIALGRSLVSPNSLVDDVGLTERSELQQLLAQQFRANGRNFSQLVSWVVRSDAFAREAINMDRNRWLQASESDLENWHLAEMTFAARTSLGEQAVKGGLESSLAAAVKWNKNNSDATTTVLAQPSLDPKAAPKTPVRSDVVMPSPGYAIHRGRLSPNQQSYVAGLAASNKLTWEQKVEHIVTLSPALSASGGVKQLSDELLKSLGDPKAALTELMWAVQNADAS